MFTPEPRTLAEAKARQGSANTAPEGAPLLLTVLSAARDLKVSEVALT